MIQILGLRTLKDSDKKYDAFHERNWRSPSVQELFKDLSKMLALIPKQEQWNLFYTLANCTEEKRKFKSQSVLAFDIDGIAFERREEYIPVILEVLGLHRHDTGIVVSGNGLHFLVGLAKPITKVEFFKEHKLQYKGICNKINFALATAGLAGACDPAIFEPSRILRLPGTVNRKPNKPERTAELLQPLINKVEFDLEKVSGIPLIKPGDQLPDHVLKKYPRFDTQAVLDGCEFLKWCKEKPNEVTEPQWYAALSITGVLENGKELSHELSRGHRNYTAQATDEKLAQALGGSRPRTCKNIDSLWTGCVRCPHQSKIPSPMSIRSEGFIRTELTGFHTVVYSEAGRAKFIPNPDDLCRFFESKTHYKILDSSGIVYENNGKHYEPITKNKIAEFAQTHYDPSCDNKMAAEFLGKVSRKNIEDVKWWKTSVKDLMNFQNGVLNLKTKKFMSHSTEYGFRFVLPFDYDPEAKAPVFMNMLENIFEGNQDIIQVILEYMGYCMMGDRCWAAKALVLVGLGANGKSTLISVFKKMVGEGNYTAFKLKDIQSSEGNRQAMDGKLLNISEETPTNAFLDNSIFKNLISGDPFGMRALYKEPYTNSLIAKQIYSCNELSRANDTTHGFFRRFLLINFNKKFSKKDVDYDPFIEEKLEKELSGIFNLALDAHAVLKKNRGFTDALAIEQAVAEYKEDTDTIQKWLKNFVVFYALEEGKGKNISIHELYDYYAIQMKGPGVYLDTKNKFSKRLKHLIKDYADRFSRNLLNDGKKYRGFKAVDCHEDADLVDGNISEQIIITKS